MRVNEHGSLVGDLQHISLEQIPEYDAISYAWNGGNASEPFLCNDKQLLITSSLSEAFLMIGRSRFRRPIWADAIYINQDDSSEKNVQVPLIKEDYSKATRVLVWLGPAAEATDHAMDSVERLNILLDRASSAILAGPEYLKQHHLPHADDPLWMGLRNIFYRLWFVQEVAPGNDVIAMCGSKSISWDLLSSLTANLKRTGTVHIVRHVREWDVNKLDAIASISVIDLHSNAHRQDRHCSLTTLCRNSRWWRTSEPIDKVYAFLGLTYDRTRQQIPVDYSPKSRAGYWKVYRTVTLLMFRRDPILFILQMAGSHSQIPNAPSWCINLDSPELPSMLFPDTYQAGGPIEARDDPEAHVHFRSISFDETRITLRGYYVDEVSDVVPDPWPNILGQEQCGPKGSDAMVSK